MIIKHNGFLINQEHCDFIEVCGELIIYQFSYGSRSLIYKDAMAAYKKIEEGIKNGVDFVDVSEFAKKE